ncbi:MAG: endopeptidase La [Deltaproteobacteria bacterium]|nr:endopeptidase La [Deltaproteobacteria bacterium]
MKIFDQYFKSQGKLDPNSIPSEIPILPLRNSVLYPGAYIPLSVGRKKSVTLVEDALKKDKIIGVITQRSPMTEDPLWTDVYAYGTAAKIVKTFKVNQDTENLVVEGLVRFKIVEGLRTEPYHFARIEVIPDTVPQGYEAHIQAVVRNLKQAAQKAIELSPNIPDEAGQVIENVEDPNYLAYLIAGHINIAIDKRQEILETVDLMTRLQKVMTLLQNEVHVLELTQKINFEVRSEMDKNQREYYLREQLKAIRKELGESDDRADEMDELRAKIEKAGMPEDARTAADNELKRLSRMSPASSEYTVSRTYLDWLIDMPWSVTTKDTLEIKAAETILNEDHYGLDKVKRRILEYLAVRKLKPDMKGPILCLVGPPGVGKTSLGKSIARALDRKFVRMSLGGVRDEAEIRGHRRTYVGALPGKVVQGIKRAGSNNPVFILDEVDKVGADFRGDPSSALLEVLDPEQNNSFQDHYLDVPFDLSKVFFIATANQLDPIPAPLRDRMEVIEIPGYTSEEKLQIAKKYIVPRQMENHALTAGMLEITDDAINEVIHSYTREAGLRNFEREIASVCRAVAKEVASREEGAPSEKITVTPAELSKYLGQKKFTLDTAERLSTSGVATGLAWTPVGGDILFIEATIMSGKGNLQLTGQLGDVMKESAHAALSFVRANAARLGITEEVFQKNDIHIHVPAGAIPKDGPSAGVTMLAAITSLLTGRPVRSDTAMTGEITLRGQVLPVGGIKEKMLAARRAGIKRVVLCKRNEPDIMELDPQVKADMEFIFVSRMEELFQHVLVPEAEIPMLMKPPASPAAWWPTRIEAV